MFDRMEKEKSNTAIDVLQAIKMSDKDWRNVTKVQKKLFYTL